MVWRIPSKRSKESFWYGFPMARDFNFLGHALLAIARICFQPYYGIYFLVAGYLENVHREQDRVVAVHCVEPLHPPVISGR